MRSNEEDLRTFKLSTDAFTGIIVDFLTHCRSIRACDDRVPTVAAQRFDILQSCTVDSSVSDDPVAVLRAPGFKVVEMS